MAKTTVKFVIDSSKNSLTFSKNFRIFSMTEPVCNITGIDAFMEDIIISSPDSLDLDNLKRYIRYSRNSLDWSLWYEIEPGDLSSVENIVFEETSNFYFEIKYEYDDGTVVELGSIIEINEIKLRLVNAETQDNHFSPIISCSDERCTSIIARTDPQFKPYEVDSAIGMYREISFYTNKIFGHDVVYFRTVPESDSGDYIFKEWTLFKNVDRKCIKIMVPGNKFPSNDPKFSEFELDFQLPFEIHIDHNYFQSIFGKGSQPRYRDFLYFPLVNRMYEVQGSYLHRGFMMAPTYWKMTLKKYNPNIDTLLTDDSRQFLDNVIQSAEDLFGSQVESDIKDGTMPEQYDTISRRFDSSRNAIHPNLIIRPLKYTFNYASLIENYYDLNSVGSSNLQFELTDGSPVGSTDVNLVNLPSINEGDSSSYDVVLAYQESGPFISWLNNALITTDKNVSGNNSRFIRVRGPLDTIENHVGQSESGRYIRIESYSDLSFRRQRSILTDVDGNGNDIVKFKVKESSIVYNAEPVFNTTDVCNLSYTCLFNLNSDAEVVQFINGYDNESLSGIKISAQFNRYSSSGPEGDLNILVTVNQLEKTYTVNNFKSGEWSAMVISVSNEFNQIGTYIYSIQEDPADIINHNEFTRIFENISSFQTQQFNLEGFKYYIPSSNMSISNIRLFNTMIREEDHDFILSQQYIKDESKLIIIDNCKKQLNLPYIAKNR
jgi:hypothetical protein